MSFRSGPDQCHHMGTVNVISILINSLIGSGGDGCLNILAMSRGLLIMVGVLLTMRGAIGTAGYSREVGEGMGIGEGTEGMGEASIQAKGEGAKE